MDLQRKIKYIFSSKKEIDRIKINVGLYYICW